MSVTIYHNPRCSKSRATLELLREHGVEPTIVEYLVTPPDMQTLQAVIKALGLKPIDIVRQGEQAWRDKDLDADADDADVLAALLAEPALIERPIVVKGERAVIGRPPTNVLDLIGP